MALIGYVPGRRLRTAIAALLLCTSSLPMAPIAAAADSGAPPPVPASWDDYVWIAERRITNNLQPDLAPQVAIGADGVARFLWVGGTGSGEAYFAANADVYEGNATAPALIHDRVSRDAMGNLAVGPSIGQDLRGDIHIVYDDGSNNIKYVKTDDEGSVIVNEKQVGPADSTYSRFPALAVGIDDTVHIAHLEARYRWIDIAYDKLENDGTDIWIDRVVASDFVTASATTPVVATDRFNGNIVVVMGTDDGILLVRFNRYGVKDMATIPLRNQTTLQAAHITSAPNGSMHVAWVENGNVLYSVVNSTGAKVVDAYPLVQGGAAMGTPRLAAASDGAVLIAFEENRSGIAQVMLARIDIGLNLTSVQAFQLTNSSAGAHDPWVTFSPNDEPFVAWVDERDGNGEIYSVFGAGSRCWLLMDPVGDNQMGFVHPNETRVIPFSVVNTGYLTQNLYVDLEYAAPPGWNITVAPSAFIGLDRLERGHGNLTTQVPPNAREGDNASITLRLRSPTSTCTDTIHFPAYVQVSHELRLSGTAQLNGSAGQTLDFPLVVTNRGDVREDDIRLLQVIGAGQDWPVELDMTSLTLEPGENASFHSYITIPQDAPGSIPGLFQVAAYSGADPTVRATLQLTVIVDVAISLELRASTESLEVLPGHAVVFVINVTNHGNLPSAAKIDMEVYRSVFYDGWTATLNRSVVYLRGGQSAIVELHVYAPPEALARTQVEVLITAFAATYRVEHNISTTTTVASICQLDAAASSMPMVVPGTPINLALTVANSGNMNAVGEFLIPDLPSGWGARFVQGGSTVGVVVLAAGDVLRMNAEIVAPTGALAGSYSLDLVFRAEGCEPARIPLVAQVAETGRVAATVDSWAVAVLPGEQARFTFNITSAQNFAASFALAIDDPSASVAEFGPLWLRVEAGGVETPLSNGRLELGPFEVAVVELRMRVPLDTQLARLEIPVRLELAADDHLGFLLQLEVLWPDLEVSLISWDAGQIVEGNAVHFAATVTNVGGRESGAGFLAMAVDGTVLVHRTLSSVAPGGAVILIMPWNATVGPHNVSFFVVTTSGPQDINSTNDIRSLRLGVAALPPPSVDSTPFALFWIAMGAGALLAVAAAVRLRRKNGSRIAGDRQSSETRK